MKIERKFDQKHAEVYYNLAGSVQHLSGLIATTAIGVTVWDGNDKYFIPMSNIVYIKYEHIKEKDGGDEKA